MGAMYINVILSAMWVVVAIVLLAIPQTLEGQPWAGRLLENRHLLGGVALVLAVYNLARMQSIRAFQRDREAIDQAAAARYRLQDEHERETDAPPNPAFNFDDPPRPKPPIDRPPSSN